VDLYRKLKDASYQLSGRITHRVTIRRPLNDTAATRLKSQNSVLQKEKEANKAVFLGDSIKRPNSTVPAARKAVSSDAPRSLPGSPQPSLANMTTAKKPLSAMNLLSGTMRVLHLLALGPNTAATVAARTNLPIAEVEATLKEYAIREEKTGSYVLADNRYKDLRIWEWKHYSPNERARVLQDTAAAFDRLGYSADHTARRALIDPKLRHTKRKEPSPERPSQQVGAVVGERKESTPGPSTKRLEPSPERAVKRVGAILKSSTKPKKPRASTADVELSPGKKNPLAVTVGRPRGESPSMLGKRKSPVSQDLFELARKFKDTYSEYAKLYALLSSRGKRPKSDIQRLLSMHKELESWKKTLWANSSGIKKTST
jgi:hypothetical protein